MNNKSVKRYPLSKQVSDKLEKMIEAGEYAVGERIPTEPELMEIFQVSRNTIREAVQSLTWAGVLDVRQGDGTYVRSTNRFHANMNQKYAQVSLADIREARNSIEVTIAHLAAMRRNEEDIEKLTKAFEHRREQTDDVKENTKADMEFHMAIANACHNAILIDLYRSISDYLESHIEERHMEPGLDLEKIEVFHENLYRAICDGESGKAAIFAQKILEI